MLRRCSALFVGLIVASSCEPQVLSTDGSRQRETQDISLKDVVAPSLSSLISDEGLFASEAVPRPVGEIDEVHAKQLAIAYVRSVGSYLRPDLEATYGSAINFSDLEAQDPFVSVGAYEPLTQDASRPVQRQFGPWYIVPFTNSAGTVVLVTAVSALNAELGISNGEIAWPRIGGNHFFVTAPNPELKSVWSREEAAKRVYQMTGIRVATVPKPIHPGDPHAPTTIYWEVDLEEPFHFRSSEGEGTDTRVYYGPKGRLAIGYPVNGSVIRPYAHRATPAGRNTAVEMRNLVLRLRAGATGGFLNIDPWSHR